jgi:hypothetical protein
MVEGGPPATPCRNAADPGKQKARRAYAAAPPWPANSPVTV